MQRFLRMLPCLLLVAMLACALPRVGVAQTQPLLAKSFVDGEWKSAGPKAPPPAQQSNDLRSQGYPLGSWGRLVWMTIRDGNNEIYTSNQQGNAFFTINLTQHAASDVQPRLHPAADRLVFVSNRDGNYEIYGMNYDRSNLVRLTTHGAEDIQPYWSPDGHRLVFSSKRDGNYNLYLMNADGTGLKRLTSDTAPDAMPSWSPDGRTIAWVRIGTTTGTIWLMNADGTNQRAITSEMRYLQHPSWSPDSTRLAFDYDRDGDGFNELATITSNGGDLRGVTVPGINFGAEQRADLAVGGWGPPGDWLAVGTALYNISGSTASLYNAYVGRVYLTKTYSEAFEFPVYDFQPDLRSLDLTPPRTSMSGPSRYTRGTHVSLQWHGVDIGVADNVIYDVQVRSGVAGEWKPWLTGTSLTQQTYIGTLGNTVGFRIRGRDAAGNAELWHPPVGEEATSFFAAKLAGTITDNRGHPVPSAPLNLAPAPIAGTASDHNGSYQAYLSGTGPYTLNPSHPGYQSPPVTTLNMDVDRRFHPYLLPSDNQVQNSSFEASASQLTNWTSGGTFPTGVASGAGLTGTSAVRLGQPCAFPCLSDFETPPTFNLGRADIAVSADGTTHVLYGSYYATRSATGVWSPIQALNIGSDRPQMVFDAAGTLHVIWPTDSGSLIYAQRSVSGVWSGPTHLGPATDAAITVDKHGQVYVSATCWGLVVCAGDSGPRALAYYRKRTATGVWLPPVQLIASRFALAVGPDDRVYVAWQSETADGYVAALEPDGSIGTPRLFAASAPFYHLRMVVDGQGIVHIFRNYGSQLSYTAMAGDGEIAPTVVLPQGDTVADLALDATGTLHLLNDTEYRADGMYYRTKTANGSWSAPVKVYETGEVDAALAVDPSGGIRILYFRDMYNPVRYQETRRAGSSGSATIGQTVVVPASKPTLAFAYSLWGASPDGSRLDVTVSDGATTETVLSMSASVDWSLASIDLGRWAGRSIDISLTLHQADKAVQASALIDDVSVGSWQTPVIFQITLASIEHPAQPTQITITGENFLTPPEVRVGTTILDNVEVVDEQTLRATVPSGIKPGRYDLWVTNPGGQAAVQTLLIGKEVRLPLVAR